MMNNEQIDLILTTLNLIKEDDSVPRNVKARIDYAICCLNDSEKDFSLKINSVLQELDEVSNDKNLPTYTRVEILNIIGILGGYQ
ncbi:MAG: UPF0147 family protein [Nanoarchaeota archaeon]